VSLLTTNYLTPTGREEAWRFTPLKRLAGLHDLTSQVNDRISLTGKNSLPTGVTLAIANAADHPPVYASNDLITNRIREKITKVLVLSIAKDVELTEPIILNRNCTDSAELSRVVIQAGVNSKSTVIIENVGAGIVGEEIEISLASGASLSFVLPAGMGSLCSASSSTPCSSG